MYIPGRIIYFDPFYFKNGNPSKPKYFIVLYVKGNDSVVVSLPTRTDSIPGDIELKHGCIEEPSIMVNCYHFEAGRKITTNDFSFDMPTFVYGYQVDDYPLELLNDIYKIEGVDYAIIGELTEQEFSELIKCFINSSSVKRKYKKLLQQEK